MGKMTYARKFDTGILKAGSVVCACFLAMIFLFYWIVADKWDVERVETDTVSPKMAFPDTGADLLVEQKIVPGMDVTQEITFWCIQPGDVGTGNISLEVMDDEAVVFTTDLSAEHLPKSREVSVTLGEDGLVNIRGKALTLRLKSPHNENGLATTFAYGASVDIGKLDISSSLNMSGLTMNGLPIEGHLYCILSGYNHWPVMQLFFPIAALLLLLLLAFMLLLAYKKAHHQFSITLYALECYRKYSFLIRQLVSRDFNTKYRRSVLGVLWSFLNPLLTMTVQYFVFSVLFQSTIEKFPLYLLSGIVIFNFFVESVSMGLDSITANVSLISKVYMPKYIYPISKVLSSLINLLISFIPLFVVMLVSQAEMTKALLLLPILLLFLILFCCGMSFLLSTAHVFFRDTKFLWGVFSVLWTYITPIFYPESIIPVNFLAAYRMNPMYQFLSFFRSIVLYGITPPPATYIWCILCALLPLILGLWVFRKKQDDFILYL